MIRKYFTCLGLFAGLIAAPASAGPLEDALKARLLPGWRMEDGRHMAALEIALEPGWKTYWRAPGDAGIPPQFDWRGSGNLARVQITWPAPEVMDQGGAQVLGYSDRVILPLLVHPASGARDVALSAEIDLGVCKEVCLPVTVQVEERLPHETTAPDPRIAAALAARPYSAQEGKVRRVHCRIDPIEDGLRLSADVTMPSAGGREVMVIETDNPQVWVAQGEARRSGGALHGTGELYHVEGRAFALDRSGVRITVIGANYAVDIQGCSAG